jgi:PAS domain S-box-containing protein
MLSYLTILGQKMTKYEFFQALTKGFNLLTLDAREGLVFGEEGSIQESVTKEELELLVRWAGKLQANPEVWVQKPQMIPTIPAKELQVLNNYQGILSETVQSIIGATPVGICITNKEQNYVYVNPAYCRLYGYPVHELLGKSFLMVVPPEYQTQLSRLHDDFLKGSQELRGEWQVVDKSGSVHFIIADAVRILSISGEPLKVTFVVDVTQQKNMELTLKKEIHQREQLEIVRQNVDRMIRHDLRNPLSSIIGASQLALEDILPLADQATALEVKDLLQLILVSGQKLKGLMDTAVDLVQLELGTFAIKFDQVSFIEELQQVEKELQFLAEAAHVELIIKIIPPLTVPGFGDQIWVHRSLFSSILTNAIRNALEAAGQEKNVQVVLQKAIHDNIVGYSLIITNQGIIPEGIRDRLFRERVASQKPGGTGIGTYIVGLGVRAHGGFLDFTSKEFRGTELTIWLPEQPNLSQSSHQSTNNQLE